MYIASVVLLILASSVFPWESFNHNYAVTSSLFVLFNFFAAIVGSQGIVKILDKHFTFTRIRIPVLVMIILVVVGTMSYFGSILSMTTKLQNSQVNIKQTETGPTLGIDEQDCYK